MCVAGGGTGGGVDGWQTLRLTGEGESEEGGRQGSALSQSADTTLRGARRGAEAWVFMGRDGAADDLSQLKSLRHLLIIEAIICSQPP